MREETVWIDAAGDITEGDVIRWSEPIWSDKKTGRGKDKKYFIRGKQQVIGQVIEASPDLLTIKIIEALVTETNSGRPVYPHKPETIIKKKQTTLTKGNVERLKWSDESARNTINKNFGTEDNSDNF
jgi:hypothetical protein